MTENIENLILEQLRAVRNEIQTLPGEMRAGFDDLRTRSSSLESPAVVAPSLTPDSYNAACARSLN